MGKLKGKVAIVTGGAGGIGGGTSRYLAAEGAAVVVADLPGREPKALADELTAAGHRAIGVAVDISDEAQVAAMAAAATDTFGRIDGLHANAAATPLGCQSAPHSDPDCGPLFDRLGLGDSGATQSVFRKEAR